MRPTLLPSLLETRPSDNLKHEPRCASPRLAHVYLPSAARAAREGNLLALALPGIATHSVASAPVGTNSTTSISRARSMTLSRPAWRRQRTFRADRLPVLHPGRAAALVSRRSAIGILGELRPDRAAAFGIEISEWPWPRSTSTPCLQSRSRSPLAIARPRFLPVEQDFAVVVTEEYPPAMSRRRCVPARPPGNRLTLFDHLPGSAGRRRQQEPGLSRHLHRPGPRPDRRRAGQGAGEDRAEPARTRRRRAARVASARSRHAVMTMHDRNDHRCHASSTTWTRPTRS